MATKESFFRRLTRLFRSGPAIQRKIKGYDYNSFYDKQIVHNNYGFGPFPFKREQNPFSVLGAYGLLDRLSRYAEYGEMEYTAEIATALNIYADESCSGDDKGKSFHIYSDNPDIRAALEELFYDVVNIEFNLRPWIRNLVKYGDCFLYNEVAPDIGVISVLPIFVNEMEREEGFDLEDPYAVRFKWIGRGQKILENWQVTHMRLLGNDTYLPYGSSILDSARRVWRQLVMIEDAMLLYRMVRSPERRVFYIDVSNVSPTDIPNHMEQVKASMRSNTAMDRTTGRSDYRYNPLSVDDDYFIPVRGTQSGTKIDTLAGGQHVSAVEDVEYIQKKLTSALMIPRAYLGFDESLSSKATLSQQDIRFSRTINMIQKVVIAELNKLAILHLYAKGYDGEDLIDFELRLSNPSTVAMQQKLQLWKTRFEIADAAQKEEGQQLVDSEFLQKEVLGFTGEEIKEINKGLERDKIRILALQAVKLPQQDPKSDPIVDPFDPSNYNLPGGNKNSSNNSTSKKEKSDVTIQPSSKKEFGNSNQQTNNNAPIKVSPYVQKTRKAASRKVTDGASSTFMPDINRMLDPNKNPSLKDIYDSESLNNPFSEGIDSLRKLNKPNLPGDIRSMIRRFEEKMSISISSKNILTESSEQEKELKEEELLEDLGIDLK